MDARRPFTQIAAAIFLIMAAAHLYRLVSPFEVTVAGTELPQWVSLAAAIVTGLLSLMLLRESAARR